MKMKGNLKRGLLNSRAVFDSFGPRFLDESFCRMFLIDLVHMGCFCCPFCHHSIGKGYCGDFYQNRPIYCPGCRKVFRATTRTLLSYSKLNFRKIILLSLMLELGFGSNQIARRLGIARHTIPRWRKKLDFLKKAKSNNG